MAEARRANQEYVRARDEMKDALVQKFSYRFGKGEKKDDDEVSIASKAIRDEVDGLLIGAAQPVTEANLARLERRLWRQAQGKPIAEDSKSVQSISAYTAGSIVPRKPSGSRVTGSLSYRDSRPVTPATSLPLSARGSAKASGSGSGRFPVGRIGKTVGYSDSAYAKRSSPAPVEPNNSVKKPQQTQFKDVDWSTLDKLAGKLHEKDTELQRAREKELQSRLKEDLDKQIVDVELKKARKKDEDRQYYEKHIAVFGDWKDQEKDKARLAREKALTIQRETNKQIMSDRARKDEARRLERKEADELVQRVKKEDEEDKMETENKRQLQKERVQKALQDSSAAAARREEEMKKKAENEETLMQEYRKALVDRDKRCQEEAWQKAAARRHVLESTASTRQKAEKQKQEELEARVERERTAKDSADIESEQKKSKHLNDARLETQQFLFEQMRQRAEVKEKEKEAKKNLGSKLAVDAKGYQDSEAYKTSAQRQRALEHRAELERQMVMKRVDPTKKDIMSSSEVAMNRSLLERGVESLQTSA